MSRHRDVRNLDYDEEYDEAYDDAVYGHSVDDHEFGVSPNTEQYLYNQRDANYGFGAYFTESEKIDEEDFEEELAPAHKRRDSSNYERPRLSSEDELKLNSVLDEVRNVVGDQFSEAELVRAIMENNYDFEPSLNAILTSRTSSGSTTVRSSGYQASAQLPKTPKSEPPLRVQDESFKFYPFSFMLPLSYFFSSAFVFEKGHKERVPVSKYVKEWELALRKISKEEKEKSLHKEFDNLKKMIPLNANEKLFLLELKGLSHDYKDSKMVSSESGSASGCAISVGDMYLEQTNRNSVNVVSPLQLVTPIGRANNTNTDESIIKLNNLSMVDRAAESKVAQLHFPTSASEVPDRMMAPALESSDANDFGITSFKFHHNIKPGTAAINLASSPPPGFNVPHLNSNYRKLINENNLTLKPKYDMPTGKTPSPLSGLSILAKAHLKDSIILNGSGSSTEPANLNPITKNKTSLSDLANAHFGQQQANKLTYSISSCPLTIENSVPPLCSNKQVSSSPCAIPAFRTVQKSESGIPIVNLGHSPIIASSVVPKLCTSPAQDKFSFAIPAFNSMSSSPLKLNPDFARQPEVFQIGSPVNTENSDFHKGTQISTTSPSHSVFLMDDTLSPNIDLNVALTKNKIFNEKLVCDKIKEECEELAIETMPSLTLAESRWLKRSPTSGFGKVIRLGKRGCKKKVLMRRQLLLPYRPFDFSVLSPDEVVRKALEINLSKQR